MLIPSGMNDENKEDLGKHVSYSILESLIYLVANLFVD